MRTIVFDIETSNTTFSSPFDPASLDLAIICIYDSETDTYSSFTQEELPALWKILEHADMLVGYNSDHFDIPVLNKYYPGDLKTLKSLDLLKEIYQSLGRRVRLDAVAEGTLGEKKIGSGADAPRWWQEGKYEKVREYCLKDVEITKRIFDYALEHGSVKYAELGSVKDVPLKTEGWLDKKGSSLTHTLGF